MPDKFQGAAPSRAFCFVPKSRIAHSQATQEVSHPKMPITTDKCLIIPDVHQNIAWVRRVLAQEKDYGHVVFLGDYFDSRMPVKERTGVAATCTYLNERLQALGKRVTFLLGNHDIQYLEAKPACDHHRTPRNLRYKCGSAYSHAAAANLRPRV